MEERRENIERQGSEREGERDARVERS